MNSAKASCPYCGASDSESFYQFRDIYLNSWQLNNCKNCGIYFLNPRPIASQLEQAYDHSYYGFGQKKFGGIYERFVQHFRERRARSLAKVLKGSGKVIDIGCGSGDFLATLGRYGDFELWGTETGKQAIVRTEKLRDIHLLDIDLSQTGMVPGTYDAITCFHVFEHVQQPAQFLDNISNMAVPGSILDISFPNIRSLQARLFRGNWLHLDPPRHLHHMAPKHLIRELEERGFMLLKFSSLSLEQNPFGLCQSLLNVMLKNRDILFERLKGNSNYSPGTGSVSILFQKLLCGSLFLPAALADLLLSPFKLGASARFRFIKTRLD